MKRKGINDFSTPITKLEVFYSKKINADIQFPDDFRIIFSCDKMNFVPNLFHENGRYCKSN